MKPNDITKQTYNDIAELYEQVFMDSELYTESFAKFLKLIPLHSKILEIGCGPGNVSRYLLSQRPDLYITGIDNAERMIERARRNCPKPSYQTLDCMDIDTLETQFDVVISAFCTPYISLDNCKSLFTKMGAILKPGGLFYLSTMEDDPQKSGYQGSSSHDGKVYIYYHQASDLVTALESNGFKILDIFRQEYKTKDTETTDVFVFSKFIEDNSTS